MRLIPVIDLLGGYVVRGVAGRRSQYRPLVSQLVSSADPAEVVRALVQSFGCPELYVADLDGITRGWMSERAVRELGSLPVELWIDAGTQSARAAEQLASWGAAKIIVGLETLPSRRVLEDCVASVGLERLIFSLDLRDGKPITAIPEWAASDALAIADDVISLGIRQLILLDIARVGMGQGPGTEDLCRRLHRLKPAATGRVDLFLGGGSDRLAQLDELEACGADGVLIASALHDGRITPEDVHRWRATRRSPTVPGPPRSRPEVPAE